MAKITIPAIPYSIQAPNNNNNEVILGDIDPISTGLVIVLTVLSGTFKFNVIGNANLSNLSFTSASPPLTLTIPPGKRLNFIATTGDIFQIEI